MFLRCVPKIYQTHDFFLDFFRDTGIVNFVVNLFVHVLYVLTQESHDREKGG